MASKVHLSRRERKVKNLHAPEPSSCGGYRRQLAFERMNYRLLEVVIEARRLFAAPQLRKLT